MPLSILPFFDKLSEDKRIKKQRSRSIAEPHNNTRNTFTAPHPADMSLNNCSVNDNFRFVKKIGAGTYGLIYQVEDITTKKVYAAKLILKRQPKNADGSKCQDIAQNKKFIQNQLYSYFHNQEDCQPKNIKASEMDLDFLKNECVDCTLLREVALHLAVHEHPNVITIHKVFNLDKVAILILMDYYPQGDLFHNIIDNQIFTNPATATIDKQLLMKNVILQLIEVVNYCAERNIYHCDIKPENVMVKYNPSYRRPSHAKSQIIDYEEIQVVLIDFGLAMNNPLVCCNVCRGSSFYMAPERITNYTSSSLIKSMVDLNHYKSVDMCDNSNNLCSSNKYFPTLAGDIWSLAVLFLNITCSRNPWPIASIDTMSENQVFHNYIVNNNKTILRDILPISKKFNTLLNKVFVMDPSSRLPLQELAKEIRKVDFFYDYPEQAPAEMYELEETEQSSEAVSVFSPKNCSSHSSFLLQTPVSSTNHNILGKVNT